MTTFDALVTISQLVLRYASGHAGIAKQRRMPISKRRLTNPRVCSMVLTLAIFAKRRSSN